MISNVLQKNQPDILEVISDLSSDEVFTPPKVVNRVLDLLPEEVWSNPQLTFLDPGTKTGVFLREITKRLMTGLAEHMPDEKERLDHILQNMVWGVAITELTSLIARRTVYCSKDATSEHSIVKMAKPSGNVWFDYVQHDFVNSRCSECGASSDIERPGRDNHAYAFVHKDGRKKLEKEMPVKFDVIIGNPPYQMEADSEGKNVNALYDAFVEFAMDLNPSFISMIIPSRWMAGGRGLDDFRDRMLTSSKLSNLVDYPDAGELFPSVEIKGGVCYFLWEKNHSGLCKTSTVRNGEVSGPVERNLGQYDIFVRDSLSLPILEKVIQKGEKSLSEVVSTRDPFGPVLGSNFTGYRKGDKQAGDFKLHMIIGGTRVEKWVSPETVTRNHNLINCWKVLVPKAGSDGGQKIPDVVIGKPFVAEPGSVCSPTYLVIGPFATKEQAENAETYLRTRFARFLLSLRKISQNSTSKNYQWVPAQDWSQVWTDEMLFEKYGFSSDEQAFVEKMIKEMSA